MVMRAVAGSWGLVGVCAGLPGAQTAHPARKPTTPEVCRRPLRAAADRVEAAWRSLRAGRRARSRWPSGG